MTGPQATITFSHLRWNFVYQRPQHLLSRLSARHPVYFVEEPVPLPANPGSSEFSPNPG